MDTQSSQRHWITNQGIAFFAIFCAVCMTFGAFWLSRQDHDLKLMALSAVLSTGGTLTGIAGTLLVGSTAYKKLTAEDLPAGSVVKDTTTVQTPPVDPAVLTK